MSQSTKITMDTRHPTHSHLGQELRLTDHTYKNLRPKLKAQMMYPHRFSCRKGMATISWVPMSGTKRGADAIPGKYHNGKFEMVPRIPCVLRRRSSSAGAKLRICSS